MLERKMRVLCATDPYVQSIASWPRPPYTKNVLTTRKLGTQGLQVSSIGLGCWEFTGRAYGPADDAESARILHRAIELGVNFFDTAEAYGPFTNEEFLGRELKQYPRNKLVIATKFGMRFEQGRIVGTDSGPAHIREVVDASLRRLQTDYIDLLYQHRVDFRVPIEDTAGAVADLVSQGKVRYFGLSEAGDATIRRAHAVHPVSALQSEYSLFERNLEPQIIPTLRELGIGLVPFAPLGRGFLSGDVKRAEEYPETDWRHDDPRFQGSNFDANVSVLRTVRELARAKNATHGQIALAWLLHIGADIVPIPGTTKLRHLEENIAASELAFTDNELRQLDNAFAPGNISGPRYNDARMRLVDR
jgi:aryl-alcohol dehydrogenase-like predicted oxidoreductase